MSLKLVFILTNSVIPDEMPRRAAFHLVFHCLPKYLLTGIQNEKGEITRYLQGSIRALVRCVMNSKLRTWRSIVLNQCSFAKQCY